MTINTKIDLELKDFESVIITALEGGSNYWYVLRDSHLGLGKNDPNKTLTERIAYKLFTDPDYKLEVYDVEHTNDHLGTVTQSSIIKAFEQFPERTLAIIKEEYDAGDADVLFQYATMGQIVFG